MISTAGLSATLGLKLLETKRESFETSVEKNVLNKREIEAFRSRIGKIETVDDLVKDYEVYSFVMKTFDLEDQMFGKAMMKKVLTADPTASDSLVKKLTDARFREINSAMGFGEANAPEKVLKTRLELQIDPDTLDEKEVEVSYWEEVELSPQPHRFTDSKWIESMVDRYVDQQIINNQLDSNPIVGNVLHVQAKAEKVSSWYNVLADTKMRSFFYTALGLPESMGSSDIDRQVKTLQSKFDIKTLNEPGVLEKLTKRYVAIAEANAAQANLTSNPILQLFGNSAGQQSITSINLSGLQALKASKY